MKKLVQHIKSGKIELVEVPSPSFKPGFVLVRTFYSAISIGTELGVVELLKSSLIQKIRRKPETVKKVLKMARRYGVNKTRELIENSIDRYFPLGYSLSGEVILADEESEFERGDIVACGGSEYASHQEIALVPRNLCVKVPEDVPSKAASFSTIGAISVWALREANAVFGERGLVVGLGLIGSITSLLGAFSGVDVYGVDTNNSKVKLARESGINAFLTDELNEEDFDFVIVSATSNTPAPLEFALKKVRRRGRIVVVGAVPVHLDRNAMYEKEVRVSVSRSYGPGRYDPYYELLGYRFPSEYVRWDIKENMRTFLNFLKQREAQLEKIITMEFDFKEAPRAYEVLKEKNVTGAVFKYSGVPLNTRKTVEVLHRKKPVNATLRVGVIGAGRFVSGFILPNLRKNGVNLSIVCNEKPESSLSIARRFSFSSFTTDVEEVIKMKPDLVIIGTRHDMHGQLVKRMLKEGIAVYVEKPLSIYPDETDEIANLVKNNEKAFLYVGFNRRFAPLMLKLVQKINRDLPVSGFIRVNAGELDRTHWTKIGEIGGDRIVGEVCHFIDVAVFLSNSPVKSVYVTALKNGTDFDDNLHVTLKMENGSVFTILYTEWGSDKQGKEYYEVHQGKTSLILRDFRKLTILQGDTSKKFRSAPDKGHGNAVKTLIGALKKGTLPIPYRDIFNVTYTTFAIRESIREGKAIKVKGF